jgi:hypothetical protein
MIGFCCLNFGEFTKTTTGYAYENNGIRFNPIKKEKGLRLPCEMPRSPGMIKSGNNSMRGFEVIPLDF